MKHSLFLISVAVIATSSVTTLAAGIAGELATHKIEELVVTGAKIKGLQGEAESASVGTVLPDQLKFRPVLRPAEVLETIPGMVVTQHSGAGKANQYFLRGFNLDHGTDFANVVEGVPVNMVTHGHGQGYTDLNFLIPEMIGGLVYKKGPYYADEGDFSSAGSARIDYANTLSNSVSVTAGEGNYQRALLMGGASLSHGRLSYALESLVNDGPWEVADDFEKLNGVVKYSRGDALGGQSLSAMYYHADWHGTDQIPQRLVDSGELDRYGSLDSSTGGDSHRYSLSVGAWGSIDDSTRYQANVYAVDYELNLSGNFTYFSADAVDDPNDLGDQVTQFDRRRYYGGRFSMARELDEVHDLNVGVNFRYDDINDVGVGQSHRREIHQLLTRAAVEELSYAGFASLHSQWNTWFASMVGARYQAFDVDVSAKADGVIEGSHRDDLISPSLSLRFGPFSDTEFFINMGEGFHSNDARGVVADSTVPLLAQTQGYELGLRTAMIDDLQLTLVVFRLDLDSELIFVGDDGTTEPKGASTREGIEIGAFYQPADWFVLDIDYAASSAKFNDEQYDDRGNAIGDYVPDSIDTVFSMGASFNLDNGVYGGLRVRYFGPRKLNESGDVKSDATQLVNANLGYRWRNGLTFGIEALNLFDAQNDDITYLYASRTLQERQNSIDPIEGFHSHPVEPRTLRATVAYHF